MLARGLSPTQAVSAALYNAAQTMDEPLLVVEISVVEMSGTAVDGVADGGGTREIACVQWVNAAAAEILGREAATIAGTPVASLLSLSTVPDAGQADGMIGLFRRERAVRRSGWLHTAAGTLHAATLVVHPVPEHDVWTVRVLAAGSPGNGDSLAAARSYERKFTALTERTPVPTVLSDVGMRLAHVNDAFSRLLGVPAENTLGIGWLAHVHAEDLDALTECAQLALAGRTAETTVRFVDVRGELHWTQVRLAPTDTPGHGPGFVGTVEDVTQRREFEELLSYQAEHDALTGLPNRTHLWEHLALAFRCREHADALEQPLDGEPCIAGCHSSRGGTDLACFFLDLDNFKLINDSLGHDAGDVLLVEIAERLRHVVRTDDLVSRFGGDEFVVVCHGIEDDDAAATVAGRILATLTAPFTVGGVLVHPTGSLGVARVGEGQRRPQDLVRDADIAMYEAKRAGKNRFALCDQAARETAHDALQLVSDLRQAIEAGELDVVYQPIVAAGECVAGASRLPAVEALARWNHPHRGPISPVVFVELAESNNLVGALGEFVLDTACAQLACWQRELGADAPQRISVNLSASQLTDPALQAQVESALARHGLVPDVLCLELTESALMVDPDTCRCTLLALRARGVSIAIDDFGTGYSSLAYLQQLPVDYLKIDQSFVADLGSESARVVVAAVVSLARSLGLSTIAEGVERTDQAAQLRELGADFAQGWLYAKAMPGEALASWLHEWSGSASDGEVAR